MDWGDSKIAGTLMISNVLLFIIMICLSVAINKRSSPIDSLSIVPSNTTFKNTLQPNLPGIIGGVDRPRLIIGQDINFPPFATLDDQYNLGGFGYEMAMGVAKTCDWDLTVI